MLGIREFAAMRKTTEPVIRGWIYRHGLKVIKIGKKIYIDEDDYQAWLELKKTTITRGNAGEPYWELNAVVHTSGVGKKMKKIY